MTHAALVQKRKAFDFEALGLKNPSKIGDQSHVESTTKNN